MLINFFDRVVKFDTNYVSYGGGNPRSGAIGILLIPLAFETVPDEVGGTADGGPG